MPRAQRSSWRRYSAARALIGPLLGLTAWPAYAAAPAKPHVPSSGAAPTAKARPDDAAKPALEVTVHESALLRASTREPYLAATIVPADELRVPGVTLGRVLSRVPGVEITRAGAQADFVSASLRGATSAQTPVYLAGIRLNDEVGGSADLSLVPVWLLQRLEVYRGNAPEHAAELGIGGAIFAEPYLPRRTELRAGLTLGSFGERAGWAMTSVGNDRSATTLGVRLQAADNAYPFLDDNGTRFVSTDDQVRLRRNADFRDLDVWALQRLRVRRVRLTTLVNAFEREQGVTGLSLTPAEYARQRTRRLLLGVAATLPCSQAAACEVELSTSAKLVQQELDDPRTELTALLSRYVSIAGRRLNQRLALNLEPHAQLKLRLAADTALETLAIERRQSASNDAERRTLSGASSAHWQLSERWSLHGLARAACHTTSASLTRADALCDVVEPTGRLSSVVELTPTLSALANVGRYVRLPTLAELYGSSPVVRGNAELSAETAWSGDAGLRFAHAPQGPSALGIGLDAFAFARDTENLIGYRRASLGIVRPYNLQSARTLGVELAALLDAWRHLRVGTAATFLDARDTTPGNGLRNDVLPLKSRLVLAPSLELYAHTQDAPWQLDGASLRFSGHYRSSRYAESAGLVVLEPQTTCDIDAGLRFADDRLRLGASAENIFDARYLDIIGLPLAGRSFHLNAESFW